MIFLPRTDLSAQEECRTIVETEIIEAGYTIYGWRQVPVDESVIGDKAQRTRPEIEKIMIAGPNPATPSADGFDQQPNGTVTGRERERSCVVVSLGAFRY